MRHLLIWGNLYSYSKQVMWTSYYFLCARLCHFSQGFARLAFSDTGEYLLVTMFFFRQRLRCLLSPTLNKHCIKRCKDTADHMMPLAAWLIYINTFYTYADGLPPPYSLTRQQIAFSSLINVKLRLLSSWR